MKRISPIPCVFGAFCAALLAVPAVAQCPTVHRVQNYTDGVLLPTGWCEEVNNEGEATVIRSIPAADFPIQVVRIGVGWRGSIPGFTQTEQSIQLFDNDPLGPGFGPAATYTFPNPTLVEGIINEFDISQVAVPWIVTAQPFTIFVNSNGTSSSAGCIAHDGDGCTLDANRFRGLWVPWTPGWYESCTYPNTTYPIGGDVVIWVEYVRVSECPVGTPHCFGDGSGTPCPCGNSGASGRGCENSFTTGGGRLEAHGVASVSADSLQLRGAFLPPTSSALFFQGTGTIPGGAAFGDGLRCVNGSIVRMGTNFATGGEVDFGYGVAGDPLVHVAGGIPPGGGTREYQIWYRNAIAFCSPATFNLTNAVTLAWSP
jgi:hypothetical protein